MEYISRQDVLSALYKHGLSASKVCTIIKDIPLADVVEKKTGKWIIVDIPSTGWFRVTCSKCGEDVTSTIPIIGFFPNAKAIWNYCPNCGCSMRETE